MASVGGDGGKKSLDFEIVLTPFIDLFSVCISFSLLTAVWLHIGSMDVRQAVGGQAKEAGPTPPSVWAKLDTHKNVSLEFKDAPKAPNALKKATIAAKDGKVDLEALTAYVKSAKGSVPDLNTALIFPEAKSVYEDLISIMDKFKAEGVKDLGVSPL